MKLSCGYHISLAFIVLALPNVQAQDHPDTSAQRYVLKDELLIVELLSPISTVSSHQGDYFSASVIGPAQFQGGKFQGGTVYGRITKVRVPKPGLAHPNAEIQFAFETLRYGETAVPIFAVLQDVANSKGVKSVDEEGRVIGKTSNGTRVGTTVAGAVAGAVIGGVTKGAGGAAIGAAAGGSTGLLVGLTLTASGSQIEFKTGAIFTLKVSNSRSNPH